MPAQESQVSNAFDEVTKRLEAQNSAINALKEQLQRIQADINRKVAGRNGGMKRDTVLADLHDLHRAAQHLSRPQLRAVMELWWS